MYLRVLCTNTKTYIVIRNIHAHTHFYMHRIGVRGKRYLHKAALGRGQNYKYNMKYINFVYLKFKFFNESY